MSDKIKQMITCTECGCLIEVEFVQEHELEYKHEDMEAGEYNAFCEKCGTNYDLIIEKIVDQTWND